MASAGGSFWAPDGIRQFGNASSAASGLAGPSFTIARGTLTGYTGLDMPGVSGSACGGACSGLSFASVFTGSTDLRLKSGSPVIGAGATFSLSPGAPYGALTNATDFFGVSRSPSYDIGAAQFSGAPPPAAVVGGSPARLGRRL